MLRLGSTGPAVQALQTRLAALRYLPAVAVDEHFGLRTWHAVVAFQGWSGVACDGVVGPQTRGALDAARAPEAWSTRPGFEIHVPQQVLLMIRAGRVTRAIHVSTGAGGSTPTGHFRVVRRERMSWSSTFGVWMPYAQYFSDGYALHGFPSVPTYPASHGCVRVPEPEAVAVWRFGRRGTRVWVGS
jgi:peptidoglycan hydrolase-like protein with peptidoglycan-binding domain